MKIFSMALASIALFASVAQADDYQMKSAAEKRDLTWQKVSESPYEKLPEMNFIPSDAWTLPHVGRTLRDAAHLGQAFDHVGDEMPPGRTKVIHAYGSSVKVDFVSAGRHPFTGLFRTGALGIARLSLGTPHSSTGSFVPGLGLKLFIDGQPSKNMHVMQKLEGQDTNQNYFANVFTNKLPEPNSTATKIGRDYFARFVKNPIYLTVDHVASVNADGSHVFQVHSPSQIFFAPAEGLRISENGPDFRAEFSHIPAGTKLYDVFGTIGDSKIPVYIGEIITGSEFVASEYGDKKLYFQHEGTARRSFWWGSEIKH
jgi:hypothetical protein